MKKTVFISSVSTGIGLAIHKELEATNRYPLLASARAEIYLSDIESIDSYLNKNSKIDIVINNAAII